jgi:hypothetical protein
MQVKPKVIAAITAALHCYFQMERQMAAAATAHVEEKRAIPEMPPPPYSPWVMSGRQAAMEMRRHWQMRLVR